MKMILIKLLKKIIIKSLHSDKPLAKKVYFYSKVLIKKDNEIITCILSQDIETLKLLKKIKRETKALFEDDEGLRIFNIVKSVAKIDGDIVEVGVYKGASAKIIYEAKGDKVLHLFDTFSGLSDVAGIDGVLKNNDYASSYQQVKNYLNYPDVFIYKGYFPKDTGKYIEDKRFSFVNLDVDTYKSTKNCLEFFYPRMNKGGAIIVHDYSRLDGVKKVVDDFFCNKSEIVVKISCSQCLIIK